ncbi:MAG: outer membrane beta-barrel protein [Myxococcota bacterium]
MLRFARRPSLPLASSTAPTTARAAFASALATILFFALATPAAAQDWGSEPDDSWGPPSDSRTYESDTYDSYSDPEPPAGDPFNRGDASASGWSGRAGLGFTADPSSLLLNFDFPYYFDRFVAVGPMLQVGIDEDETIIAPTLNLFINIPDIGVAGLERVQPYGFVGLGFAVVEDDDRSNDNSATDFLINFGVGIEYQISEHLFLGSHMTFNFLPNEALSQEFFYSWQVGGARIAF